MKRICTVFLLLLGMSAAHAQLAPDGSVIADFTATDIDGNTHNLYSLLDDGYTVFLDLSATWCGPCWNYHNSGALEGIIEEMGEDGLDKVAVFFIERDAATTLADLQGTGSNTQGDWTAGTNYPIIDDAALAATIGFGPLPTVYKICPDDKTLYYLFRPSLEELREEALEGGCAVASTTTDAATLYTDPVAVCASFPPSGYDVDLFNLGTATMTSATLEVLDGSTVVGTENWTGSLSSLDNTTVTVNTPGLTSVPSSLTFRVTQPGDANSANNDWVEQIETAPSTGYMDLVLRVKTDAFGNQTYWEFRGDDGTVYASGGNTAVGPNGGGLQSNPAGGYAGNTVYLESFSVPSFGCYNLVMVDDWGDGISSPGNYRLQDADGNIIFSGPKFNDVVELTTEVSCNGGNPVTGLSSTVGASTVTLSWNAVKESVGCRVSGRPIGAPGFASQNILGFEVDQRVLPLSILSPGIYEFTTTCACSISPLVITPQAPTSQFIVFEPRLDMSDELGQVEMSPNPATDLLTVNYDASKDGEILYTITDMLGVQHTAGALGVAEGSNQLQIDLTQLQNGLYLVNLQQGQLSSTGQVLVQR